MAIHTLNFSAANHRGDYDIRTLSVGDVGSVLSEIHIIPDLDTYDAGLSFANGSALNGEHYVKLKSTRSSYTFGFKGKDYFDVAKRFNVLLVGDTEVFNIDDYEGNIGKPLLLGSVTAAKARRNMVVLTVPIDSQSFKFTVSYT